MVKTALYNTKKIDGSVLVSTKVIHEDNRGRIIGSSRTPWQPIEEWLDLDHARRQCCVRTPQPGDRVRLKDAQVFDEETGRMLTVGRCGRFIEYRQSREGGRWGWTKGIQRYVVVLMDARQDILAWRTAPPVLVLQEILVKINDIEVIE